MKMRDNPAIGRMVLSVIMLLAVAVALPALDLSIDYVEGYVDIKDGSDWAALFIGDVITSESVIRLEENSLAEISGPGIKLTLTKPGVYDVNELVGARNEQSRIGLASIIGKKVASVFEERPDTSQTAVMGVRGAKSENELDWMMGDTVELLESGKEQLRNNEVVAAFATFEEAFDFAEIDEENEVLFYLGYTSYLMGNTREALGYFNEMLDIDPDVEFFPNLLLLKAQLLAETFAYEDAVEWLGTYEDDVELSPDNLQTAYLIEGVSYKGLENVTAAREALQQAVSIDPSSEVGQAADRLIESLGE